MPNYLLLNISNNNYAVDISYVMEIMTKKESISIQTDHPEIIGYACIRESVYVLLNANLLYEKDLNAGSFWVSLRHKNKTIVITVTNALDIYNTDAPIEQIGTLAKYIKINEGADIAFVIDPIDLIATFSPEAIFIEKSV